MTRLPLPSRLLAAALCVAAALVVAPALAAIPASVAGPVKAVPQGRLDVAVASGHGELPLKLSRDWTIPQPDIERALVVIHGWSRRGVDDGDAAAARAGDAAAHTLVVAPLFPI